MVRVEFTFGIGLDRDGNPIARHAANIAIGAILADASKLFGGGTLVLGQGFWRDPATGVVAREDTATIHTDLPVPEEIATARLVDSIKRHLNQAAVRVSEISLTGSADL